MNKRSALMVFLPALAAACGGGGGGTGGSNPLPIVSNGPGLSPTATVAVGIASGGTASVSAGAAQVTVTVPGSRLGAGNVLITGTAGPPAGLSPLSLRSAAATAPPTAIACVSLNASSYLTINSSPALRFTLANAQLVPGAMYYLAYNRGYQWEEPFLGPVYASGAIVTFPQSSNVPFYVANQENYYCLYAQVPTAVPTPIAGGGTLALVVSSLNTAAHSAVVSLNGANLPVTSIPSSCGATCTLTMPAPAGASQALAVRAFAATDGTGTPLDYGSGSVTILANSTSQGNVSLTPVLGSMGLSLIGVLSGGAVSSLAQGNALELYVDVAPYDALGAPLQSTQYVDASGAAPSFRIDVSDPTGQTSTIADPSFTGSGLYPGTIAYSGFGTGPVSVNVVEGAITASVNLPISPVTGAAPNQASIGGIVAKPYPNDGALNEYGPDSLSPIRTFLAPQDAARWTGGAFDSSGTLWVSVAGATAPVLFGLSPAASIVAVLPMPDTVLASDSTGRIYTTATGNEVNVYSVSGGAFSLLRTITSPGGQVVSAAADAGGNVFMGVGGATPQIYEFAASGNGSLSPLASTTLYGDLVAVDKAGNTYAVDGKAGTIVEWRSGTFPAAPSVITVAAAPAPPWNADLLSVGSNGAGCVSIAEPTTYVIEFATAAFAPPGTSPPSCKSNGGPTILSPF